MTFEEYLFSRIEFPYESSTSENAKLQENLKNLQNLEGKMKEELSETKEKMKKMEEEIEIFKDLDKLKRDSANKKIVSFFRFLKLKPSIKNNFFSNFPINQLFFFMYRN